ncbi:recombination protein NinB [Falsirhodobacter xinxiangensis]|uniref:recombination protein NinB n=1 Tax=Falsirhodobacter xinxiangensis TaxID=2530049 RepID=UPI0010AAC752|nr:recombination protein NinB [Rhodobacter xinxiangensis]
MAGRHAITLKTSRDRAKLGVWTSRVPDGWRVEFKEPKRSDEQNDRMWEMLSRIAKRMTINGKAYPAESWKCIFMRAMGKEASFLPTLDGESFFPTGFRSSDLTVREMSDMQTFIESWCAEQGVDLWSEERKQ